LENWNKIYPDRRDAGFPDPVLAARKRHAEQQAQQQPTAAAQEPQSPKPVIWDESRRWKLSCDAVRYATSLNARVGYSKQDADISFLRRALESVLWKTEEATKIHVTEDVLFAIIKEELALCGDDAALADFGTYLCMNLAEQLNARLQPATAGEKL
jgi:riboflavin biosynthesis pyrimidine reductase